MAGLLDNPKDAAMLQLGLGLLSRSGPSRMPVSIGQALGDAGQEAIGTYRQAQQDQQANMGALLRKEKSVIVGLVAELCKHISGSDYINFEPPSIISTKPHLGDIERYPEDKLKELAEGVAPFNSDYVSIGVAESEIAFRVLNGR